jgi:hypothetical protein
MTKTDAKSRTRFQIGDVFGRLTIESDNGEFAHCVCDCGSRVSVRKCHLRTGATRSCGCLNKERTTEANTSHGMSSSGTYKTWAGMMQRCTNKKNLSYANYGGRGIQVCERWHSFENFLADMGERPQGMSIERVNNDGSYEPSNCRWASRQEQNENRRNAFSWVIDGVTYGNLADPARVYGVSKTAIMGWCRGYKARGKYYPPRDGCKAIVAKRGIHLEFPEV